MATALSGTLRLLAPHWQSDCSGTSAFSQFSSASRGGTDLIGAPRDRLLFTQSGLSDVLSRRQAASDFWVSRLYAGLINILPCLSLVPVVDAPAVAAAFDAGVASSVSLSVGGKHDSMFSQPVDVVGRVAALSEGVTTEVPGRGLCSLGRTALIECGAVRIALMDHRSFGVNHPLLYTHLGIDISDAKLVVLKTASNFQFFARWRKQLIRVDTPGTTQSNLAAFEWKNLPRPIDPFEEIADWNADSPL